MCTYFVLRFKIFTTHKHQVCFRKKKIVLATLGREKYNIVMHKIIIRMLILLKKKNVHNIISKIKHLSTHVLT